MRGKPVLIVTALLSAVIFLFAGCGNTAEKIEESTENIWEEKDSGTFPYTFTDSLGNEVTLNEKPKKVAVLFSSYGEIWKNAGGEIAVTVGDTVERGFASENALLVDDGAGMKINGEGLIAAEPDFVIASGDMSAQKEICERLSEKGIPCGVFREETFDDYLNMLKIFTDITGNKDAYKKYGEDIKDNIDKILSDAGKYTENKEPLSVLFIRAGSGDSATKAKTAADHFVGIMLNELGTVNIADEAGILSERLSLEHILLKEPDIILTATQGDENAAKEYMNSVLEQPGWNSLKAVSSGKCCYLPKDLFHYKPNQNWDKAYEYLENILYSQPENSDE